MKKQNIEDIFSSMEDFSSVPPPELWGQIEEKLDKPKKKKRAILWWSAAACLLLGLMLPSVLHFNSASGIKTIKNDALDNSVVLDDQKNNSNTNKTISAPENNTLETTTSEKKSNDTESVSSVVNKINQVGNSQKNQNQKTTVAHSDAKNKNNSDVLNPTANTGIVNNNNKAVAEKVSVSNHKNGFNSDSKNQIANVDEKISNASLTKKASVSNQKNGFNSASQNEVANVDEKVSNTTLTKKASVSNQKNGFNSDSKNQIANVDEKVSNATLTKKASVSNQKNGFNSDSQNQIANVDKKASNTTLIKKASVSNQKNGFNSGSKNQIANVDEKVSNATLTKKASVSNQKNGFNSGSQNKIASADKKASDKVLAEKTFGKKNPFNPTSKNQLSKSFFEDQSASKKSSNIASNAAKSNLNGNPKTLNESITKQNNGSLITEKQIADNQKSNSKFKDVLSPQDSVQLAELQNLEKGIITPQTPEEKIEKEKNPVSNAEKWAVEVFAGVASSENYKNDKTLGNENDSKQSNSYGVKTKYKINKKWAVASGFKINELGQSVANVSYLSAKNNAFFSSSDYFNLNTTAAAPRIAASSDVVFVPTATANALKQNNIESNNIQSGNLDQNLRYIEMPLEVSYSIFSKNKASINLNTGGFVGKLISNNVALDGNSIGQNVNANNYVYGSTLSSTLQYRVYKKTNFFVEPAMNYYINPLNNQSFNQFQWGLNFGLNVSF
ncbi:hypothetical protein [Flavobacterium sp.]|uniref:hypothetical protein n=1 Tax=Flavobacterium sp. TaxID=239 RepID=UPI00374DAEF6